MKTGLQIIREAAARLNDGQKVLPSVYYRDAYIGKSYELTYSAKGVSFIMASAFPSSEFEQGRLELPNEERMNCCSTDEKCIVLEKYSSEGFYLPMNNVNKLFEQRDKRFMKSLNLSTIYVIKNSFEAYFPGACQPRNGEKEGPEKILRIYNSAFSSSSKELGKNLQNLKKLEEDAGVIREILEFYREDIEKLLAHYSELNLKANGKVEI